MPETRVRAEWPRLVTDRLILRGFEPDDAEAVQALAGAAEVAAMTMTIPHPYPDGMAEEWIAMQREQSEDRTSVTLAITRADNADLIGAIGFLLEPLHERGELGYWIGKPFWNWGYATEAVTAMIDYGFRELRLNRIEAQVFPRNPASSRVLEKAGMMREGILRERVMKDGEPEDLVLWSILARDWPAASND